MILKLYTPDGTGNVDKEYAIAEFEGDKGLKALRQVLISYRANKRQGNASTKTRAEVAGTAKKPFRQKGIGIARQGTKKAPQHYKGGVAWGPRPRDYTQQINRKMKILAFSRALYNRASSGEVEVIERFEVDAPKTKVFDGIIGNIIPRGKVLIVDDGWSDNVILAARNIKRVTINSADTVNALDLSLYDKILISEKGIEKVISRTTGGNS